MNLKEQLAQKKADLLALKEAISEGDAEAIKAGTEIQSAIEEIEASMTNAAKAKELLASMGGTTEEGEEAEEGAKSLGELAAKSVKSVTRGTRFSVVSKAATDTHVIGNPGATTDYDRNVYGVRADLPLSALFSTENISGNAITFYVESAAAGNFEQVAEDGKKPQLHFDVTPKTVALTKLAGVLKESDEIVEDAGWMADAINSRGVYKLQEKEEAYLVETLLATDGIQAKTITGDVTFDDIHTAITNVLLGSGKHADAIVMNPATYDKLCLTKDSNGNYLLGGPAVAQDAKVWGLPVIQSVSIDEGTVLVGAFKQGSSIARKGGVRVETTNSNEDDFVNNRTTIRIEERLALVTRFPGAFVKISK